MDNIPTNKSNLISQKFWAHTKEIWDSLSIGGKQKWFARAIELTQNAWADATASTDLACPLKFSDFEGKSPNMFYGTLRKACKNTWDAVAVKQILLQLYAQYKLRDTGEW